VVKGLDSSHNRLKIIEKLKNRDIFVNLIAMDIKLHKDSILALLSANKPILASYGVNRIGLFGSYVRNQATAQSDIDLLVDIKKEKKTFSNFLSLSHFLEKLFDKKVELVTTQSLSPYIGPHILKTVEYVAVAD
jgi:predicted nucleotidyltransferase